MLKVGAALVVLITLIIFLSSKNDRKDEVASLMESKLSEILKDPRARLEMKQKTMQGRAYSYVQAKEGLKHLDLPELLLWNDYRIKMAQKNPGYCAAILTGNFNDDLIMEAYSTLKNEEVIGLSEVMLEGAKRKLNREGETVTPSNIFQEGIQEILLALPEEEQDKFAKTLASPESATEVDNCWTSLKLLQGLTDLSEEKKLVILKTMTQN
jgi:hypothetical protein